MILPFILGIYVMSVYFNLLFFSHYFKREILMCLFFGVAFNASGRCINMGFTFLSLNIKVLVTGLAGFMICIFVITDCGIGKFFAL